MWKVLFRARHRFDQDQRGNVAVIFAFSLVPLIGLLGGAVDLTRHQRYKTEVLNAMDSAAIALVRRGATNDSDADNFVNGYITPMLPRQGNDRMLHLARFDAIQIPGGYRVVGDGFMDTAFLPVVGIEEMPLALETEVINSAGKYEVVLALDNTGSMAQRGKIDDLKRASHRLVENLYAKPDAEDLVKMALVPFVTSVNIRGEAFDPDWLNRTGTGEHDLDNFDRPVDRLQLFDAMGGGRGSDGLPSAWKGCVEARGGSYALDDTAPDLLARAGSDEIDTRWTPYFWPDDADDGMPSPYSGNNDYTDDQMGSSRDPIARLRNVDKYLRPTHMVSSSDTSRGPNRSCAGSVVELTNDVGRMEDAIDAMKPHPGSGTNIAEGLAWGWRVLSPGAPFDQGVSYDDKETVKALVLLSDGKNEIGGDYTGWGHLADDRLGRNMNSAVAQMNRNVTTVCNQVRAIRRSNETREAPDRIRLYMILLQVNDRETQRIFEDCASTGEDGEVLYYFAPDGDALDKIFADIGKDLTNIRITR